MYFYFDNPFEEIAELIQNQPLFNESQNFDSNRFNSYPSDESPDLNSIEAHNDCNNAMPMKASNNNIEENQDLNQKATSDKTQEKKEENIKKDDKKSPFDEISKININENWNSGTKEKKLSTNTNNKKNKKKKTKRIEGPIFVIIKINKNKRKFAFDNIMKKIKAFLLNSILYYVNPLIKGDILLKIVNEVVTNTDSVPNKKLLKTTLKEILSLDISNKTKNPKDHNRKIIKKLYEEKNKKVMDFLNLTLEEFIRNFKRNPKLKRFYDNFIKRMKQKKQPDSYIGTFEYYFDNYVEILEKRRINKNKE